MKKIVFTGGGTAGHIMPNLAIIEDLRDYKIYYIGSNGMEKNIITKYPNIEFIESPTVKFYRGPNLKNLLIPFKLLSCINKTKQILKKINPCIIFSKGGYVSVPTCLAGNALQIPVITHESDISIGLANKIIAKKAKYLCCSFQTTAESYKKNAIFTGSPIRKKILHGDKNIVIKRHNISTNKPILLIVGGSQGAQAINEIIWNNIHVLIKKYTLIHIVGKNKTNTNIPSSNTYIQLEFVSDIENYFQLSDIVISRAGSNTIFELLAIAKPMILVPLPQSSHSRGDQIHNATYFHKKKYANLIFQEDLTINTLLMTIQNTITNKDSFINRMKKANNTVGNQQIINLINKTSS